MSAEPVYLDIWVVSGPTLMSARRATLSADGSDLWVQAGGETIVSVPVAGSQLTRVGPYTVFSGGPETVRMLFGRWIGVLRWVGAGWVIALLVAGGAVVGGGGTRVLVTTAVLGAGVLVVWPVLSIQQARHRDAVLLRRWRGPTVPDQERRAPSWGAALATWVAAFAGTSAAITVIYLRRVAAQPSPGPERQVDNVVVGAAVVYAIVLMVWFRWRHWPNLPAGWSFGIGFLIFVAVGFVLSR